MRRTATVPLDPLGLRWNAYIQYDPIFQIGVFIDLKKAFDTVDHGILIEKLYHYGIRGIANKWIGSYLMNRYQYVNNYKWFKFGLHECAMWSSPRIYFRANLIHTLYK